jgi:DNA replication protein DnaC
VTASRCAQRLTRLLDELALARIDGKATRLLAQLARIQLLILDDWAMARLTAEQRRDLMEVIDDRHQRASTILATQIPIERWHDTIGDPTYADAILDRLVHNAYRIELRGDSMRRRKPGLPARATITITGSARSAPSLRTPTKKVSARRSPTASSGARCA